MAHIAKDLERILVTEGGDEAQALEMNSDDDGASIARTAEMLFNLGKAFIENGESVDAVAQWRRAQEATERAKDALNAELLSITAKIDDEGAELDDERDRT